MTATLLTVLLVLHIFGFALGLGAATAKTLLLVRCPSEHGAITSYALAARPITKLIVLGLVVATASGVALTLEGQAMTTRFLVKIALVALLWGLGPVIDRRGEPRFFALAPAAGETASPGFEAARRQLVVLEIAGTGLFYAATVAGVLL